MKKKYILTNLAGNLREIRVKYNKTQIEVCTEMGINHRTYQRLENDSLKDVKLSTVIKILEYYNITLEELLH